MTRDQKEEVIEKVFRAARHGDLEKVRTAIESGGVSPTISRDYGRRTKTLAHVAAKRGDLNMLKYLLERDSSLLTKNVPDGWITDSDPDTILETAVAYGQLDIVKYLVETHKDDICRERAIYTYSGGDYYYRSPVSLAISRDHLNVLKYFIEELHVNVDTGTTRAPRDYSVEPPLFHAVRFNRQNITNYLIEEKKANLSTLDIDGQNILYDVVNRGDLTFIKFVLDEKKANIDINWRDRKGQTLVRNAVESTSVYMDVLKYLVEQKKADLDIPDEKNDETALHVATRYADYDVFKFLVDHGADLEKKDKLGRTALHLTVASQFAHHRDDEKCKYLLEHGANVKEKNNEGQTPLDMAVANDRLIVSKYLIERMDDVNERDERGETLIHKVVTLDEGELLYYLVNKKHADVNIARNGDLWTPLHCAAFWEHKAVCKYLIAHGADPMAKDRAGKTPAQIASKKEVIQCIKNASTKIRSRRYAAPSVWIPSAPQIEAGGYKFDRVTGDMDRRVTTFADESRAFQFQSFLLLIDVVARYLFRSARKPIVEEYSLSNPAEILSSRMDRVVEDAVHTFADIREEETYN